MAGGANASGETLERAAFVISIDTEMSWGMNHHQDRSYRYDAEREHLDRLVELLDRHHIPATWAVVGHLMLDECRPVDGVKHPEIIRPTFDWFEGDWFDDDPATDAEQAPTWYAPDVIELITSAKTDHEVATHGFSHIMAGEPGCSRECFDSEIRAAVAAAAAGGLELRSIIHPRNQIGHLDVLIEHGITSYRGRRASAEPPTPWHRLIDQTVGSERTAIRPQREDRIWNFPATIMFDVDDRQRTWPFWVLQVRRRLQQAVRRQSLFHMWFHPHNLRDNPDRAFEALDRICGAAAKHRDDGHLDTVTMGSLAARLSSAAV